MIKTFHDQNAKPSGASEHATSPAPAKPLFAGAVTHQTDPHLSARLAGLTGLVLQPTSPARIASLLNQLPQLTPAQALNWGQDSALALNRMIDDASHIMLHPSLGQLKTFLQRIMQTLEVFAAPYQRKAGWLNRMLGQDSIPQLTQEHYLQTKASLARLLEGLRPLARQLSSLMQRLQDLQLHSQRMRLQFDEQIAAVVLHLEDHPEQPSQTWEESREAKLSRRLMTLRTLAESSVLQTRQLGVSIEQLHQLQERLNEIEQVIFPLWQQQCLALLSQQDQRQGVAALMDVQQQFIQSIARSIQ